MHAAKTWMRASSSRPTHPVSFPTNQTGGTLDEKMASVTRWQPTKQTAHREGSSRQELAPEHFAHIFSNQHTAAPVSQPLVPVNQHTAAPVNQHTAAPVRWHVMNPATSRGGFCTSSQGLSPETNRSFQPPQEKRNHFPAAPSSRDMAIAAANRDINSALDVLSSLSMPERPSGVSKSSLSASLLPLSASLAACASAHTQANTLKRLREADNTGKTDGRRRRPSPADGRHAYRPSKAHNAYGKPQEYICGYCGAQRTSASACTVSRLTADSCFEVTDCAVAGWPSADPLSMRREESRWDHAHACQLETAAKGC